MKVLRAFQVINQDGQYMVAATYNEVDDTTGQTTKHNVKYSFYAVEAGIKKDIEDVEAYIMNKLEG
jgi:hypothetical protein